MRSRFHVVVWVHHGLGDVIMVIPALVSTDRKLPLGAHMTLLVKSATEESLLRLVPWRHTVEYINLGHIDEWSYRTVLKVGLALRRQRPQVLIAPHASSGWLPPLFSRLVGAPIAIGPHGKWWRLGFSQTVPLPAVGQHKVEYYAEFARRAGLSGKLDSRIDLTIQKEREQLAADWMPTQENGAPSWIIVAPGSGPVELHKRWPPERYRELIMRLISADAVVRVLLLGSPAEATMMSGIAEQMPSERVRVVAQPDIELAFALIRRAAVIVCSCGGAGHMAALAGTPIVGLYGPTNPNFTGPFSSQLRLISRGYSCAPCYRPGFERGCGNPICMTDISVDEVLSAVVAVLEGAPFPALPDSLAREASRCGGDSDLRGLTGGQHVP